MPDGRLVGVLTERDIFGRIVGGDVDLAKPVESMMTTTWHHLHLEETVRDAIELMQTGRYRNVPLLDDERPPRGVVRPQDILKFLAEAFPEEILNLPPRPHQLMEEARRARDDRTTAETARTTPERPGAGAGHDPLRRRLRRRHAADRHAVHPTPPPSSATTSARCPTSPPRSAPRPARCPASPASRSASRRSDIHTPGDAARRARRDEPGRAQDERRRPARRAAR